MLFTPWLRRLKFSFRHTGIARIRRRSARRLRRSAVGHRVVAAQSVETLEDRTLLAISPLLLPLDSETKLDVSEVDTQPAVILATADPTETVVIDLPGLYLVDPSVNPFDGQVIYLDFDGAVG